MIGYETPVLDPFIRRLIRQVGYMPRLPTEILEVDESVKSVVNHDQDSKNKNDDKFT